MTRRHPLMRPRDTDALREAMRTLATTSETPVLFAGEVHEGALLLTEFVGVRTNGLRGLTVVPASGLGGRVVEQRRAAAVSDYGRASAITHDYDGPVLGEGLRSVLAVPVVVDATTRAVLYAARRDASPIGGRTADSVIAASRRLAMEISVRDEVDRRTRMLASAAGNTATITDSATVEELRSIHAQLRDLAARIGDTEGGRARDLSDRLARVLGGGASEPVPEVNLSRREIDVLAVVSLGSTNAEAAKTLSLRPETVKSYLRSAMQKMGVHNRHEAVVMARRMNLLP
ncbi:helix-turn-helix transcriptional regulator [Williamsia sp.]|uniref:helix-turn-helix transcriptional regulator n=1 Tax=Williamsia sp. TaxID=1872085 RepID=UPI002F943156